MLRILGEDNEFTLIKVGSQIREDIILSISTLENRLLSIFIQKKMRDFETINISEAN